MENGKKTPQHAQTPIHHEQTERLTSIEHRKIKRE